MEKNIDQAWDKDKNIDVNFAQSFHSNVTDGTVLVQERAGIPALAGFWMLSSTLIIKHTLLLNLVGINDVRFVEFHSSSGLFSLT